MKRFWIDMVIAVTSGLLVLPVVLSWVEYSAPLLGLIGVLVGAGWVIFRTSHSLWQSYQPERKSTRVEVLGHSISGERRMNGQPQVVGIAGATLPPPKSGLVQMIKDKWGEVWNSKKHSLILVCAVIYVISPVDIWPEFLGGFIDDGFAVVLGAKHLLDMLKGEVAGTAASMQTAIARAKQREANTVDGQVVSTGRERV